MKYFIILLMTYNKNNYIKNKDTIKSYALKRYYDLKEKKPQPIINIKYENIILCFN